MDRRMFLSSKKRAIYLAVLVFAIIGGLTLLLWVRQTDAPRNLKQSLQPAQRMRIEGLRFYGMSEGRRVIAIEADRFAIQKGKIGFFSTGLTQTARIVNARIDLYVAEASAPGTVDAPPGQRQDYGNLFSEETFSSLLPSKNLSAIEAAPVLVRLHGSSALQTRIEAARASVRFRERDILFEGNVRVSAEGAELQTEQLVFIPETALLKTDKPYLLKKGDRTIEGTGLTTDILLQPQ